MALGFSLYDFTYNSLLEVLGHKFQVSYLAINKKRGSSLLQIGFADAEKRR
jgi:hypothetical protein